MPTALHIQVHPLRRIAYAAAWREQETYFSAAIARKKEHREQQKREKASAQHHVLLCEHPPVITLGRGADANHLLTDVAQLANSGIELYYVNRGGDITYHGPGQLVVYPILDLSCFFEDLHRYLRCLEEVVIQTLADWNLKGARMKGHTGVWIGVMGEQPRKICAIGIHVRQWVTLHGLALNVGPKLAHFDHIVPCGIQDKGVTSMERELGYVVDLLAVSERLQVHMGEIFSAKLMTGIAPVAG